MFMLHISDIKYLFQDFISHNKENSMEKNCCKNYKTCQLIYLKKKIIIN